MVDFNFLAAILAYQARACTGVAVTLPNAPACLPDSKGYESTSYVANMLSQGKMFTILLLIYFLVLGWMCVDIKCPTPLMPSKHMQCWCCWEHCWLCYCSNLNINCFLWLTLSSPNTSPMTLVYGDSGPQELWTLIDQSANGLARWFLAGKHCLLCR